MDKKPMRGFSLQEIIEPIAASEWEAKLKMTNVQRASLKAVETRTTRTLDAARCRMFICGNAGDMTSDNFLRCVEDFAHVKL